MAKSDKDRGKGGKARAKGRLEVVDSVGGRSRFLRGMITHDLVQRGLDFDDAYTVARSIRGRLSDRDEVSTAEIRDLIEEELESIFDGSVPLFLKSPAPAAADIEVLYDGQRQPFSRGLLARSVHAAGISLDRAYQLVTQVEADLRAEGASIVPSPEIARRVDLLIDQRVGAQAAKQYRLVRRLHNLPRPLVVYIGGASGTGKSTLALELAPLLRIYRLNATDTIRQVMRMVFTPSIMPALHTSSFEVIPDDELAARDEVGGSPYDPDFSQRLIASFDEQASRVCVGVRAVVERAIAENMSIVVEGVHLHPSLVPFRDLEGAAYQVPLVLATLNEETHRSRFLSRTRLPGRRAERYLQNFDSIRIIHDYLLQQAEANDIQELDTSQADPSSARALRLVTAMVERRVPSLARAAGPYERRDYPTLMLVIDGMADRPVRALGGRTPLQAARTPILDRLAREGRCGLADAVAPGVVPDTASGSLALLGQSPLALKRGPVEAIGAGLPLAPNDVALRGNFATLDGNGVIVDRRAGRIREEAVELAAALDRLDLPGGLGDELEVRVAASTEHRVAIVLTGDGLSSKIQGSDPGEGSTPTPALAPRPLDPHDEAAVHTARALAVFEQEAQRVLSQHPINADRQARGLPVANAILTRGAGRVHRLVPLEEASIPLRISCISGDRTMLGLCGWLGANNITHEDMTANLDTDLDLKFREAIEALESNDLVILHVKGADIAAHDRRPDLKVAYLEKLDGHLADLLDGIDRPLRIAIASDHATLSESGQHSADSLPVVIWGQGIEPDEVESFDEASVATGALQQFPLQMLMGRLFDLS